jgi:hypothetical protein
MKGWNLINGVDSQLHFQAALTPLSILLDAGWTSGQVWRGEEILAPLWDSISETYGS